MDSYKLTYFNLRGIAEPARLLLKYKQVPFEDVQVDVNNWKSVKEEFKWQQLPYLEHNGKVLTQSGAIVKYLGLKFNLIPDDPWDQAKCEEIYGAAYDIRNRLEPLTVAKFEGNMELAKELTDKLLRSSSVPLFLSNLNELLTELRCKTLGDKSLDTDMIFGGLTPTWADFCLANFLEMYATSLDKPNLLDEYPQLKKQQDAVYNLPGVCDWIRERPKAFI